MLPDPRCENEAGDAEYEIGQPGAEPRRNDPILTHGESHALDHEEDEGQANAAGDSEEQIPAPGWSGKWHGDDHDHQASPGCRQSCVELGVQPRLQVGLKHWVQLLVVDDFLQRQLRSLNYFGSVEIGDAQFAADNVRGLIEFFEEFQTVNSYLFSLI